MDATQNIETQVRDAAAKSQAVVSNLELQLEQAKEGHQKNLGMLSLIEQLKNQGAAIQVPTPEELAAAQGANTVVPGNFPQQQSLQGNGAQGFSQGQAPQGQRPFGQ